MNIHGRGFGDYTHTPISMYPLIVGHIPTNEYTHAANAQTQYMLDSSFVWNRQHCIHTCDERDHKHVHEYMRSCICGRCTASALKIHCWAVCVLCAESSLWFLFFSSSNAQLKSVSLSYFKRAVTNRKKLFRRDQFCVRSFFVSSLFRCLRCTRSSQHEFK